MFIDVEGDTRLYHTIFNLFLKHKRLTIYIYKYSCIIYRCYGIPASLQITDFPTEYYF